jgi:hypothetical protein
LIQPTVHVSKIALTLHFVLSRANMQARAERYRLWMNTLFEAGLFIVFHGTIVNRCRQAFEHAFFGQYGISRM